MPRLFNLASLDGDARAFSCGYLLLLPLYIAPLLVTRYLPGLDLPFHFATIDLLNKAGDPNGPYAPFYRAELGIAPYAAHFFALWLLGAVMPLMTAQKIIIAVYVATFPLTTAWLLDRCGRSRVPALLAFPLAYNLTLHYGFVSFALSLPVLMLLLATLTAFLTVRDRGRAFGLWLGCAAVAVLLFVCHLQNFLFGLCAAGVFILLAGVHWKRRGLALLAGLPSIACLITWHTSHDFAGPMAAQQKSMSFAWEALKSSRLSELPPNPEPFWDLAERTRVLPVHLLRGFMDKQDIGASRALLLVLGGFIVLGLIGLIGPGPGTPKSRMRIAGWVTALGAAVAYYGLPHHLRQFELTTFYPRFSVLLVLTGLLLIPGALRRYDGVGRLLVLIPPLVMAGLYSETLLRNYRLYDVEVADFAEVVAKVPPGGRVLNLTYARHSQVMRNESALVALPHFYPSLRPHPQSMVSQAYCNMRHMPCRLTTTEWGKVVPDPGPWALQYFNPTIAVPFYDYFFVRMPPPRPIFGAEIHKLKVIAKSGSWIVYGHKNGRPKTPPAQEPPGPSTKI